MTAGLGLEAELGADTTAGPPRAYPAELLAVDDLDAALGEAAVARADPTPGAHAALRSWAISVGGG